jgi:hypothetical protein
MGNGGQVTITEGNDSAGAGLQHATLADTIAGGRVAYTATMP